ncbi:MAG: hypothetical protein ACOYM9_12550 [Bradymonadia bacterium]|jgi:hypothetical protein
MSNTPPSLETTGLAEAVDGHFPVANHRPLFREVSALRERRLVSIVIAPHVPLDRSVVDALVEVVHPLAGGRPLDLFLDAGSGVSLEAWRVVSFLHERFQGYTAIVPFASSPVVTQLALGANALLMTDVASLSPLYPFELSGELRALHADLDAAQALLGAEQFKALVPRFIERVDAQQIGLVHRGWETVRTLARASLETHLDPGTDRERIDRAVDRLCAVGTPSGFPFTRRDCEQRLGLPVVRPDDTLASIIWRLHRHYRQLFGIEGDWRWNERNFVLSYDGFIETEDERRVLVRIHRYDDRGRRGELVFTRWVRPGGLEVVMDREVAL